jgi:hypothetical protein
VLQSSNEGCSGALAGVDPYRTPEAWDTGWFGGGLLNAATAI